MRLDVVVAASFNLARAKAQDLVTSGSVQVNWTVSDQVDRQISLKDVISVRKYGRICLESLSGQSKKDKIKAVFNIIHR
nr:S4 domain-containing protein [Fructobacillus cardui]